MPNSATFKFFVPFNRAYIDKATNKMMVEGLASTTEVDLTGEKMAESAIKSMASSNLPLPFRSEHRSDWDAQLGSITELSATPDHQLLMKAELDADHPNAHFLFGKLQTGSQLGLSIGGQVNDWDWEEDAEIGRSIRTYKDIALKEVSVTSHPAVQSTFLAAISKSLNAEEPTSDDDLTKAGVSASTIYDALAKVYPERVLGWVKDATWRKNNAVPLDSIDMARRPGGRDQSKVEGIASAIADGKKMEPVVLVDDGTDKLQIADGYHRTLAFEHAGKKTIPAYIGSGL